jgi:3-oxoacyl-[acyl-carrier protein] reductase
MTDALGEDVIGKWVENIPLKRPGTTEDVANCCLFLGSDMGSYVSGQVISVCGGMLT